MKQLSRDSEYWRNAAEEVRKPHRAATALSPVCEPIGHPNQPRQRIDQEQLFSETALEAASNY
jgi:hypothetical protein